jgi:hypothetical protein
VRKPIIALSVLAVACLLVGAVAAGAAGKKPFKTGLYVGKTSQGEPVKLKVAKCGTNQCVQALESAEIQIQMPCPSLNETGTEVFFPADNAISASGKVNAPQDGFSKVVATLQVSHNGSMTGRIRSTQTLEDGAKCDSGNVTLKAKIGGSTK